MTGAHEQRWQRLLAVLQSKQLLPSGKRTPSEIAEHVKNSAGDDRVYRFVHEYYYPNSYGNTGGGLSDNDADQLINSIEGQAHSPPPPQSPAAKPAPPPTSKAPTPRQPAAPKVVTPLQPVSASDQGVSTARPPRRAGPREARQTRPQLVCILADESSSMHGEKARAATEGVQEALIQCQQRGPQGAHLTYFKFLLIRFGDSAEVDPQCDMQSVRQIDPDSISLAGKYGHTNITAALELLLSRLERYVQELQSHPELDLHPVPLVMLFSDGQHNIGGPPQPVAQRVKQLGLGPDAPVNIVCFGITIGGEAVDEKTLRDIASAGLYCSVSELDVLTSLIAAVGSSGRSFAQDIAKEMKQSGGA